MYQAVLYCILAYICIGVIGMALANRRVDRTTARQRWLKLVAYILITGTVAISMPAGFFLPLALLIIGAGYAEMGLAFRRQPLFSSLPVMFLYTLIALLFLGFALYLPPEVRLFIYFQVLTFDAFSQVSGQLLGRRKVAPKVSPGKTWEGLTGGTVFCILSSFLTSGLLSAGDRWLSWLGLFTAFISFSGDLLASAVKRRVGIKDYGTFLPGQGGFLDRFDSFLMAGAVYYVVRVSVNG
ncbi:MAG TPA: phosphatidate cytidylyltransferase [Flavisolibacter sp.]|jgi:phosphatidate cytidylyltransferase